MYYRSNSSSRHNGLINNVLITNHSNDIMSAWFSKMVFVYFETKLIGSQASCSIVNNIAVNLLHITILVIALVAVQLVKGNEAARKQVRRK